MFKWLMRAYPRGMASLEQVKRAVQLKKVTKEQYKLITGDDYNETV